MKIALIGQSGVGKTTFLSALYQTLGSGNSSSGFYISPTATSFDESVFLTGKLQSFSFAGRDFTFPPGTQKTTLWSFDLRYANQFVCNFEIMEYRGGVLNQLLQNPDDDSTKEDVKSLTSHIALSDSVILFADSVQLTYFENIKEARFHSGVNLINQIFQSYENYFSNRNLNYLIALTKADAVEQKWKNNNYELLIQRGLEAFSPIIEVSRRNSTWEGGIVPISSIGEGKANITLFPPSKMYDGLGMRTDIIGFPEPMNIEHTLFFSIGLTLRKLRESIYGNVKQSEQEIQKALGQANLANSIWSNLTGKPSAREVAQSLFEKQAKEYLNLRQFDSFTVPLYSMALEKVRRIS